jgi:hypothetical protein
MATSKNIKGSRTPQSARERVEFRMTPKGVIPNSISALQKLTIEPAMQAALTRSGTKLVVEMDAGGTRVLLADQRTNQLVGGPEDLQKLGTIRAFVNRERKEAAGIEAAKDVTQLAFLVEKVIKDYEPGFEMKPVDNSYAAALRPLHGGIKQLTDNLNKVLENTNENHKDVYGPELGRLFTGCVNAHTDVILELTRGGSIKGLMKERLFAHGVPEWVYSKLSARVFPLDRTGDIRRILFPTDPTKGLSLTLKEWRDDEFLIKQGPLLANSFLPYEFASDDELLRAITGIAAEVSLSNEENPQVAKLLSARMAVMPPVNEATEVIELGSKSKSAFKFPTPSTDTVQGAILALSTAMLRVYSANLQSADLVGDYYATIAPGAVRREDVTPTNNFYVQWGKAPNPSGVWSEAIKGGPSDLNLRQKVWRWIRTEMRLSEKAKGGQALAKCLELTPDGGLPKEGHNGGKIPDDDPNDLSLSLPDIGSRAASELAQPMIVGLILRPLKDTETPFWTEFQGRIFPPSVGKKQQQQGVALTPLTEQGKTLLMRVKKISPHVANRMLQWLRSFTDERLQLAAISVTNAEFDDIFSSSLDEETDAQSELDWAETEA